MSIASWIGVLSSRLARPAGSRLSRVVIAKAATVVLTAGTVHASDDRSPVRSPLTREQARAAVQIDPGLRLELVASDDDWGHRFVCTNRNHLIPIVLEDRAGN